MNNAIAFSQEIVQLALPIRMGICSMLTSESVSIFNDKIVEVLQDIAQTEQFKAAKFNEVFRDGQPSKEELGFKTQQITWVLNKLATDYRNLDKKADFKKLYFQYKYFKGKSEEESTIKEIEESLNDNNRMQIRRVLATPSLIRVIELTKEQTNPVIRQYKELVNYFCKVTLVTEKKQEMFFL